MLLIKAFARWTGAGRSPVEPPRAPLRVCVCVRGSHATAGHLHRSGKRNLEQRAFNGGAAPRTAPARNQKPTEALRTLERVRCGLLARKKLFAGSGGLGKGGPDLSQ